MKRRFNITGACSPQKHYMVRLDDRGERIKKEYVDEGCYFIINKGRQYGKTTTLKALVKCLERDYIVLFLDFQKISSRKFADERSFSKAFADKLLSAFRTVKTLDKEELQEILLDFINDSSDIGLDELFGCLSRLCEGSLHPIVLMIDEIDSAGNNQIFLDFLAQMRAYYLERDDMPIFHSVILAGVYDIKNLKLKLRPDEEHMYNSPWNIAAEFNIDMNFSVTQIASMLQEYEEDKHTKMDVRQTAECIFAYTSGYPYLVSAICKLLDEDISVNACFEKLTDVWSEKGIVEAVKLLVVKSRLFFESMIRQLEEYPEMKQILKAVLFLGKRISYNSDIPAINLASMFGYIINVEGCIQVANRIFEMRLYNLFLAEEELSNAIYDKAQGNKLQFICDGRLDMDLVVEKFVLYFHDIYGGRDEKFVEEYGRKLFLLYLRPIINGTGNYYIEAQTRDARRTDVIVDYLGEQFVIELKIWHGDEYNERGEKQLSDYLEYYHKDKGYLISFNFNKNKVTGIRKIKTGNKMIIEAVV